MILLIHIAIALSSVAFTAYTFFGPTVSKIQISRWLVGLTLGSGTVLVISAKSGLMKACITGLIYLAFNVAGIVGASRKLAQQQSTE